MGDGNQGKLGQTDTKPPFELFIPNQLLLNNITLLDIAVSHTLQVATLSFHHRDPFDRLLIAQCLVEQMPIISVDSIFDTYGLQRRW